jgi:transcriptional regulator with XRE-family HTH domain
LNSLDALPKVLIEARIAAGLTQEDLASRLGLKPQQIQRYEASDYQTASLARLRGIARVLNLRVREGAELVHK